jgi:hypothetical protein
MISQHKEAPVKLQHSSSNSSNSSMANATAVWLKEAVSLLQLHHVPLL